MPGDCGLLTPETRLWLAQGVHSGRRSPLGAIVCQMAQLVAFPNSVTLSMASVGAQHNRDLFGELAAGEHDVSIEIDRS